MNEEKEDKNVEFVEELAAHTKMELKYQMLPTTLKIQSGPYSQTIKGRGLLRTQYTQHPRKIKRGATPAL